MAKADTRRRLLSAARELLVAHEGRPPTAGAVAARAGVSRLTVYQHFGSHAGLLAELAATASRPSATHVSGGPVAGLRSAILAASEHWAADAALFRRLPAATEGFDAPRLHALASALANADELRPGCSIREAEDVIAVVTSFSAFDRLHQDGRRSPAAVAAILLRLAGGILKQAPA